MLQSFFLFDVIQLFLFLGNSPLFCVNGEERLERFTTLDSFMNLL